MTHDYEEETEKISTARLYQMQHAYVSCPVTAVAAVDSAVFVGEGYFVKLLDRRTLSIVGRQKVFTSQAVHGIIPWAGRKLLAAWGGRHLAFLSIEVDHGPSRTWHMQTVQRVTCNDWILNATFQIPLTGSQASLILVTAHSALFEIALPKSGVRQRESCLRELAEPGRSLLYSAKVTCLLDRLLITSGTALGELIVWSYRKQDGTKVQHAFMTAHDGSIFDLDVCHQSSDEPQESHLLLATCSDDRTLRLWDLSKILHEISQTSSYKGGYLYPTHSQHDTVRSCGVFWAHSSRIWGAQLNSSNAEALVVLSFGEDGTFEARRLIRTSDGSGLDATLIDNIGTTSRHSGKNIWSHCGLAETEFSLSVLTGGADGSVNLSTVDLRPVPSVRQTYEQALAQWSDLDTVFKEPITVLENAPTRRPKKKARGYRTYCFLTATQLSVSTWDGGLYTARLLDRPQSFASRAELDLEWQAVGQFDEFKSHAVTAGLPELGVAFFAGGPGRVICIRNERTAVDAIDTIPRAASGIFASRLTKPLHQSNVAVMVSMLGSEAVRLYFLSIDQSTHLLQCTIELILPKSVLITAGRIAEGFAFLGSRNGSILVYDLSSASDTSINVCVSMSLNFDEAITSFLISSADESCIYFLCTSREAHMQVFSLSRTRGTKVSLKLIHQVVLPVGSFIEGSTVQENTGHLLVYGFIGLRFHVYNVTEQQVLLALECGGPHRQWAFALHDAPALSHDDNSGLRDAHALQCSVAWTRATDLNLAQHSLQATTRVQTGSHGREIKAAAVAPVTMPDGSVLIATGAEDTEIRISSCLPSYGFRQLALIRQHVAGVIDLRWSSTGEYLFSCGGNEELFVWRVRTGIPFVTIAVVQEAQMPFATETRDLRITSFDFLELPRSSVKSIGSAACAEDRFIITAIYSDSSILTFALTLNDGTPHWALISTQRYTLACLTQIAYKAAAPPALPSTATSCFITASTDGHVALFALNMHSADPAAPLGINDSTMSISQVVGQEQDVHQHCIFKQRIHQNAIKSMIVEPLGNSSSLVITCGDDNAIGLTVLAQSFNTETIASSMQFSARTTFVSNAHAASISAIVKITSSASRVPPGHTISPQVVRCEGVIMNADEPMLSNQTPIHTVQFATASQDQTIKMWYVDLMGSENASADLITENSPQYSFVRLRKVCTVRSCIADPSSLCLLRFPTDVSSSNHALAHDLQDPPHPGHKALNGDKKLPGLREAERNTSLRSWALRLDTLNLASVATHVMVSGVGLELWSIEDQRLGFVPDQACAAG